MEWVSLATVPVFAQLPERIELDLDEVRRVLRALDVGAANSVDSEHREIVSVINLVTAKLWPELGDHLDEES